MDYPWEKGIQIVKMRYQTPMWHIYGSSWLSWTTGVSIRAILRVSNLKFCISLPIYIFLWQCDANVLRIEQRNTWPSSIVKVTNVKFCIFLLSCHYEVKFRFSELNTVTCDYRGQILYLYTCTNIVVIMKYLRIEPINTWPNFNVKTWRWQMSNSVCLLVSICILVALLVSQNMQNGVINMWAIFSFTYDFRSAWFLLYTVKMFMEFSFISSMLHCLPFRFEFFSVWTCRHASIIFVTVLWSVSMYNAMYSWTI